MKKVPLYSRSQRPVSQPPAGETSGTHDADLTAPPASRKDRLGAFVVRHERRLWALALVSLAAAFWWLNPTLVPKAPLTMAQIDAAMRQSIEDKPLIAPESRAYDAILPSVVRVVGLMTEGDDGSEEKEHGNVERGIGSGVVIIDNGTILT
ncbi:MAG TPA: peptidase S1, partial [Caldimonas sp.]|nr:peptidase S1 [Caldimonas sp.]